MVLIFDEMSRKLQTHRLLLRCKTFTAIVVFPCLCGLELQTDRQTDGRTNKIRNAATNAT